MNIRCPKLGSVGYFLLCKIELWAEVGLCENPMEVVPILDEVELNIY